jgi:hypothetical protein
VEREDVPPSGAAFPRERSGCLTHLRKTPQRLFVPRPFMSVRLKSVLTKVGGYVSPMFIHQLNATANYLETGRWFRARGFAVKQRTTLREELFDIISREIGDRAVAYLEFGVWKGDSIKYWSKLLKNPNSVLHGFDSFEGLPEAWNLASGVAAFSVGGSIPKVDDPRVRFFKGWFNETLKDYRIPPHDALVITLDADLYSSTKTVLDALEPEIGPGTYLYFDEFSDRLHELRAFDEFIERTGAKFRLVAADQTLTHVAFQRVA